MRRCRIGAYPASRTCPPPWHAPGRAVSLSFHAAPHAAAIRPSVSGHAVPHPPPCSDRSPERVRHQHPRRFGPIGGCTSRRQWDLRKHGRRSTLNVALKWVATRRRVRARTLRSPPAAAVAVGMKFVDFDAIRPLCSWMAAASARGARHQRRRPAAAAAAHLARLAARLRRAPLRRSHTARRQWKCGTREREPVRNTARRTRWPRPCRPRSAHTLIRQHEKPADGHFRFSG